MNPIESSSAKKKKKEETTQKKPAQSLSVQERQNQKSYGTTQPKVTQKSTSKGSTTKSTSKSSAQQQKNQEVQNRLSQKYGGNVKHNTPTQNNRSTSARSTTTSARSQEVQDRLNRKYGGEVRHNTQTKNSRTSVSPERSREVQERLNTKYSTGKVEGGKHTYMDDVVETTKSTLRQTAATEKRAFAFTNKALTKKDAFLYASKDQIEKANKEADERDAKYRKQIQKESEEMEKLKQGHSYLGQQGLSAVSSFVGMATDAAWGPASLAHMYLRTTESSRGDVKDKANALRKRLESSGYYSEQELDDMFKNVEAMDLANSMFQGGIEVLSEKLFTGIGAAKRVGGTGMLDKSAAKLAARLGSKGATGIAGRIAAGTGEEIAEELVGNPLQALSSNLIYGNKFQSINEDATRRGLQAQSDDLRSQIRNDADARTIAARLSSSDFLNESKQAFMESGSSEKEAEELAELSRDYLTAAVSGDTERMEELQNEMVNKLAGGENSMKERFTLQDAIDVSVSTAMMTALSGAPGAVMNAQIGQSYKETNGIEAVRNLAQIAKNLNPDKSLKAQVIMDRIDNGEDISGTQVHDLIEWSGEAATEVYQREDAKENAADRAMKQEGLFVAPAVRNEDGSVTLGEATEERYEERYETTLDRIKNLQKIGKFKDIEQEDVELAADVSTAYLMGTITANQMNELNPDNVGVRTIFSEITGVDLNQYNVYDRDGTLNIPKSNIAMQEALFANAADNYLRSARIEQDNWNDGARGEVEESVAKSVGSEGDLAVRDALHSVDPRDQSTFLLMGQAAQNVYDYALHTEDSWDDMRSRIKGMYPSLSQSALEGVFEAAKRDKAIADEELYNGIVNSGESISNVDMPEANQTQVGKFINEAERELKDSERSALESMASKFNVNIVLRPSKAFRHGYTDQNGKTKYAYDNGFYDKKTGTIYLNGGNDMERNLVAVALHELTHHIKVTAPAEYRALSNLVTDRYYKAVGSDEYNAAIERKQDLYKKARKQELSADDAFEEIIADAVGEMSADQEFIDQICRDEPTLANKIVEAIRNILRKLRDILASGRVADEYRDTFFAQIDAWDEAQRRWLTAARAAQNARADQAVDEWQENVYAEAETRHSISDDYAAFQDYIMNRKESTARWTDERIDRLIREYGASNPDYSQAYAVLMNPRDFLKLTLKDISLDQWNREAQNIPEEYEGMSYSERQAAAKERLQKTLEHRGINTFMDLQPLDEEELRTEEQTPFLTIYSSDGTMVQGHEGRHRMRALMDAGIKSVPVVIKDTDTKYSKVPTESMILSSQDFGYDPVNNGAEITVSDLVPIKESNRDELIQKFGGEAQVRFSISEEDIEDLNDSGIDVTESGTAVRYSLYSWQDTDIDALKEKLRKAGYDEARIDKWVKDVNSIAALIAGDMQRLNYTADQFQDALKPNAEYYYTLDLSTLCQKRRLYQGTYNKIMKYLLNNVLMPEDTVRLRAMMDEMGYQVPCGICYEESRKKNEGKFAERWLNGYGKKWKGYKNQEHTDPYIPTLYEVTTTEGREKLREEHPEAYESYVNYQKTRGSANPKISYTHTDYRGDILRMTESDIAKVKHIGGLRIQSFSDFEIPHVIDMMQAVMDMSAQSLTAQAYTKVPAFAKIFGGTGIKINLSLIQKVDEEGNPVYEEYVDENGETKRRLVFDSKEGIDPNEAFALREKYSKNVGTILVGTGNQQILDAWADPRVDMVIPFHRSGWSKKEFEKLGLVGYKDYTKGQTERYMMGKKDMALSTASKALGLEKDQKLQPIYSADYWDNNLSGKENAERYLALCAEKHYRPVFYQFLHDNGDGTWSLQEDGSTDGYWKSLIDFKMYDNDGNFAPQELVQPVFDMDEARQIMDKYEGGADTLPVADDVVESFLKEYKENHPKAEFSIPDNARLSISLDLDEPYMEAVNSGNMEEAQRLVGEAAEKAGLNSPLLYHGTNENFTVFKPNRFLAERNGESQIKGYFSEDRSYSENYGVNVGQYYVGMNNPLNFNDVEDMTLEGWTNWFKSHDVTDVQFDSSVERDTLKGADFGDGRKVYGVWELFDMQNVWYGDGNLTERIKAAGYDGMRWDYGEKAWIPFDDTKIKSADAVTYAEDGSVIPLSERFDPNSNDIRYSLPTQDSNGRILSDGQMEFFKNSQARDEQGRLVPVYHTTDNGGFTVFDPSFSQDKRSLFFTDNLDMSRSYQNQETIWRGEDGEMLDPYEMQGESLKGTYTVYLNLENPLIVDGMGHNWDDIPYGGNPTRIRNSSLYLEPDWSDTEDGDPLVDGYTLTVSWEQMDDSENWVEQNINEYFENPDPEDLGWSPMDNIYDVATSRGLSRSYIDQLISDAEEEPMDGSISFESEDREAETVVYDTAYTTRELAEIAQNDGHDGVILKSIKDYGGLGYGTEPSDVYIAFTGNQVKDIRNTNPTENPDIRYSVPPEDDVVSRTAYEASEDDSYEKMLYYESIFGNGEDRVELTDGEIERYAKTFSGAKIDAFYSGLLSYSDRVTYDDYNMEEDRVRMARSRADFLENLNAKWNENWLTNGEVLDIKTVKSEVKAMVRSIMRNADTDNSTKNDIINKTLVDMRLAYQFAQKGRIEVADELLWHTALRMVEGVEFVNDEMFNDYKSLRDYLRTTKISLGDEYWNDVNYGEFASFRKQYYNRIKLVKGKTNVDQVYQEMCELWPEWFSEEDEMTPPDQLEQIAHVLDVIQPYKEAYSSEEAASIATDIADDLVDILYNKGRPYESIADKYKNRYDEQAKAMKVRHEEALRRVREQRDKGIKAERAKWQVREQKKKEKADHRKKFEDISDDYNWLTKAVLDPTKDKYIPEAFRKSLADLLVLIDLQTENSKKLEEKYGRVAQKTLKMRELKDRLNDLSVKKGDTDTNLFDIDSYLPYLMESMAEKLDGKSIDEMDASDINTVSILFKAIRKNFQNLNQETKDAKVAVAADKASRIVSESLDKIEKDGPARKYGGAKGAMNTINNTSLTPAYMFGRLGTMNDLYKLLRGGFDKYIRNEATIIDRLQEILGGYYKTNPLRKNRPKPGSTIEEWRDSRTAQQLELTNGTITMTVAQRMSLYCLAKRNQACQHMYAGGIVVTPIQPGGKIEALRESRKGKEEMSETIIINEADIKKIIESLTPEQIRVADQLQELMVTDMARLGNEAHREMYGYEIFDDPNYFPIKSRDTWVPKDVNNMTDAVEKIKSFGPAKPLDVNASNAIVVDDIFTVVADHCNGMNLYNAYLVPISNFMRVYNFTATLEDGTRMPVRDALEKAYGKETMQYIDNFIRDINGIKNASRGGLEDVMNKALGTAKKTAVFGNIRVALQQPTAIVRAMAEMDGKYLAPIINVRPEKGVRDEMYKYCPIAQWKSWGYYDTYMGRDIEDVMMNNWSKADVALSGIYGELDNWTWSCIWRAVKAEQHDAHPEMDMKSEEFLTLCGERASEIFDKTQVVDSTFHRSDAMRNKQVAVKAFTAFMAEPTLTLNVLRAGIAKSQDMWENGDKKGATKALRKTVSVIVLQAAVVSAAQALADTWRGKNPETPLGGGDDDDEATRWERWFNNFLSDLVDSLHLENNIYFVKDITPFANYVFTKGSDYFDAPEWIRFVMGWNQDTLYSSTNLVFAGAENLANGLAQVFKKLEKGDDYDKSWYDIIQKTSSGAGTFIGIPLGTLMRDTKPIWDKVFQTTFAADTAGVLTSSKAEKTSKGSVQIPGIEDGSTMDNILNHFGVNLSPAEQSQKERAAAIKARDAQAEKIKGKVEGLEGEEKDKKVWSSVTTYYKDNDETFADLVAAGDYGKIFEMKMMYTDAGGDSSYFEQRVFDESKKALKKSIVYDPTDAQAASQQRIKEYLKGHGMSDAEISDIAYKSDTARELKVAFRLNDKDAMMEELEPLVAAGLTYEDLERLWKNRNRIDLKKYKESGGKYADRLKSTGNYNWPITGTITSNFGHRSSPGGIGSTNHQGLDIAGSMGDPVAAADGGTVIMAQWYGGAGKTVQIQHDDGTITQYSHLSWWDCNVGDSVAQGQTIGKVGSTGNSTGPHLHFGVIKNGSYVDPTDYLS